MSDLTLKKKEAKAKKMMLLFALLSITMTFGGLTSAYVVSKGRPDWLVDFTLPISFTYSTILLVISSVTIHCAKLFLTKPNGKSKSLNFLWATFVLGIAFLFFQFNGFNDFIKQGYYFAGAQSNVTTSFIYVLAFVTHWVLLLFGSSSTYFSTRLAFLWSLSLGSSFFILASLIAAFITDDKIKFLFISVSELIVIYIFAKMLS